MRKQKPPDEECIDTARALASLLDRCEREEDVQQFLTKHLWILLDSFAFPWAVREGIPKFKLGNEFVTDFLVVTGQSFRYEFILVEIEPPNESLFTKAGTPAKRLSQAVKQVSDWNGWIAHNTTFFRREVVRSLREIDASLSKEERWTRGIEHGVDQIDPDSRGAKKFFPPTYPPSVAFKIIIGRRDGLSTEDNERRASLCQMAGNSLEIVTYDRLIQAATSPSDRRWTVGD